MGPSFLMLCVAGLTSVSQATSPLDGVWAGATDAFGRPSLIEARFEANTAGGVRGSYQRYGDAGSGFDAPVSSRATIDAVVLTGNSVRFTLRTGARDTPFAGVIEGDVLSGRLQTQGSERSLTLRRILPLTEQALGSLVGTYRRGDTLVAVTWREFGGLRLIDLTTGAARSLAPESDTSFVDLGSLVASPNAPVRVSFTRGAGARVSSMGFHVPGGPGSPPVASPLARDDAFTQERLRFEGDGVTLTGTLLLPRRSAPNDTRHAAVAIVHGSGPIYGTALFERAAHFARAGYAVLIYDKRGTGGSTGAWQGASFEQLASDALAAVRTLRARPDIDPRRVGLQGHSQAGYVIPIAAAAAGDDVAFAIVVSGGPLGTVEQSLYDKENDLRAGGFTDDETRDALDLMRRVFAYVRDSTGDRAQLEADYLAAKRQRWFAVTDLPDIPGIPPWDQAPPPMHGWRDELRFDGAQHVARMQIPTLVLLGSEDRTVPAARVAALWRAAWQHGGHAANRIETFAGADHGLRIPDSAGRRPLAPRYFGIQREWLASLGIGNAGGGRPRSR